MILYFRFSKTVHILRNISSEYYRIHNEYPADFQTLAAFLVVQGYRCKIVTMRIDSIIDGNMVPTTDTGLDIDDEDSSAFMLKYG